MDIRSAGMQRKSDSSSNTLKRVEKADSYGSVFLILPHIFFRHCYRNKSWVNALAEGKAPFHILLSTL